MKAVCSDQVNSLAKYLQGMLFWGTYKVRNEIETKRNETKSTKTKRNETKSTKWKRNETKPTKGKRNMKKWKEKNKRQNEIKK